jgi:hypothetical protein
MKNHKNSKHKKEIITGSLNKLIKAMHQIQIMISPLKEEMKQIASMIEQDKD